MYLVISKGTVTYNNTEYNFILKILKRNKRKRIMTINNKNIFISYVGNGIFVADLSKFMKLVENPKICFDILELIKDRIHQTDKDLDVFEIKRMQPRYNNLYIDKLLDKFEKERRK